MSSPTFHPKPWYDRLRALGRPFLDVPLSATFDGGQHDRHLVFGTMVHGNEVGPLPAVVKVAEDLAAGRLSFGGRVTVFVGNPEAGLRGTRLLEADLNRVFIDSPDDTLEHRRSRELRRVLDTAHLFVDFHQTIGPTPSAFYIFPWSPAGEAWVRALDAAPRWVTRAPGQSFSPGTCCADEYVRNRGQVALTVEVSQAGPSPEAEALTHQTILRAIQWADALAARGEAMPRAGLGLPFAELPQCLSTAFAQSFTNPHFALRPGLDNFAPVSEGDVVSADGAPELVSPISGWVMMAKYPDRDDTGACIPPLPGEIYRVLTELPEAPARMYATETSR